MRSRITYGLALLALAGCSAASTSLSPAPQQPPAVTKPAKPPVVMVLGDSYTAGMKGVPPESTYAAFLAKKLGWQVIIGGYGGTGFLARGKVGKNFAQLFADQLAWRPAPDMVMVVGGHNDATRPNPAAGMNEAVGQLLNGVKQRWPGVPMVLVGPMWGGSPSKGAVVVRDIMATVASQTQVPFVDPLQEEWITGDVSDGTGNADLYIRRDEVHPTEAGNAYFADKLVAALSRLGLDKPGL